MIRIAVTGGIACGKSLVASFMSELGVRVCEADALAHELIEPRRPAYREILGHFGDGMCLSDGRIDRRRLGRRVFCRPDELAWLNGVLHPRVKRAWRAWLNGCRPAGDGTACAVVVPLLFEAGFEKDWESVVVVQSSVAHRLARLRGRGLSRAEADRRMGAQMSPAKTVALSDYVIVNNGTKRLLREQTKRVMGNILEN